MFLPAAQVPRGVYYTQEDDQFVIHVVLMDGSERVVARCSEVALVISEQLGTLVKHGPRDVVEGWVRGRKGFSVAVLAKGFPVEELNQAISDWPAAKIVIKKYLQGLLPAPVPALGGKKNEEGPDDDSTRHRMG